MGLFLLLLLSTGIKKSEAMAIVPNHVIDEEDGPYLFIRYKNPRLRSKERKIELSGYDENGFSHEELEDIKHRIMKKNNPNTTHNTEGFSRGMKTDNKQKQELILKVLFKDCELEAFVFVVCCFQKSDFVLLFLIWLAVKDNAY